MNSVFSSEGENITNPSKKFVDEINAYREEFFKDVDNNLMDQMQNIVKKVQESNVDPVRSALNAKDELQELANISFKTFDSIRTKLAELENQIDDIERKVMHAYALKRSRLEILTLFSPLEYYGHKFGFERNKGV